MTAPGQPTTQPDARADQRSFTVAQQVYLWLAGLFLSSLLIADIVGIKLFHLPLPFKVTIPLGFTTLHFDAVDHTCGMLTFPVTFLLTDLINEYYGKRAARRLTYIGFAMAVYVFIVINIAQAMPYLDAPYNVHKDHFNAIFGSAKIMYVASLSAYLVGQLSDIAMFGFIKRLTGQRFVWLRATGSTVISQFLDSFVVSYLAFSLGRQIFKDPGNPPAPIEDIPKIAITGYALKFVIAIALTPVIYGGRAFLHRAFGLQPLPPEETEPSRR